MNASRALNVSGLLRSTLLFATLALAGCYSPSPGLFNTSTDTFSYESTSMRPITITLIDVRTEEPFFKMDIPVGRQLSFDFEESGGDDPVQRPSKMSWAMWDAGTRFGSLSNSLSVPGKDCRRIEYTLRPAPEFAPPPTHAEMRVGDAEGKPEWATDAGGPATQPTSGRLYQ